MAPFVPVEPDAGGTFADAGFTIRIHCWILIQSTDTYFDSRSLVPIFNPVNAIYRANSNESWGPFQHNVYLGTL